MSEQSAAIRFLTDPATHYDASTQGDISIIKTHISLIVLVGQYAYKLKRACQLPYLDFSDSTLRLAACEQELALNRRTAPEMYLAVRRITRATDGKPEFDGPGALIDAVVQMRRFSDEDLLDDMAAQRKLSVPLMTQLARSIAQFHDQAEISPDTKGAARIAAILTLNEQSQDASASTLGSDRPILLNRMLRQTLAQHINRLDSRARAGKVRHCHGDLHLRNICIFDGQATPFDCLEFNASMATIDVLYDLAFLLMDLWRYNERPLANIVMNRYLDENNEIDGLPLLPFFMALRAAIRAQVLATQARTADRKTADDCVRQSHEFLDIAFDLLQERPARLVAVGGLSGTGKSTVAAALADSVGPAPGARILSTDRIRKHLFGVTAETPLPDHTYTPQASARVYQQQTRMARQALETGHAVIADGVFSKAAERQAIETCARDTQTPFTGVWLQAPPATLLRRVQNRTNDPSDATVDVVHTQLERDTGPIAWSTIASNDSLPALVARVQTLMT